MRKLSNKQEKAIAKDLGGSVIPNSGGLKTAANWKSDVNTDYEKIEAKITSKKRYTIKFKDLLLNRKYALLDRGKIPLFMFEFLGDRRYVITFCHEERAKEAFIYFESKASSFSVSVDDLYEWSCKGEPIVGIRIRDKSEGVDRHIVIEDYVSWKSYRDGELGEMIINTKALEKLIINNDN